MKTLIEMIMRVAITGFFGGLLGYILTMVYELAFVGGALTFTSPNAMTGMTVGAFIGAVIGFFKKH